MASQNTKRIEESATNALKGALLRCPTLAAFISENDKTPSWDGQIFVYQNAEQKKEDGILVAPVQVKGTSKKLLAKSISYPCEVADLKNYYKNGGCILFLVSVDTERQIHKIYYSGLQVYDLKRELDAARHHKSRSIHLQEFPENDPNEMTNIVSSFAQNRAKQASFVDKELPHLDELLQKGVKIENLSFAVPQNGLTPNNVGEYVSSHEIYLYAKPEGLDIEIPIDKVKNMTMSRLVQGTVCVAGQEYYDTYSVVNENGGTAIKIGTGISVKCVEPESKISLHFEPAGTLSELIRDETFMINVYQHGELEIGKVKFPLKGIDNISINQYMNNLTYCKDVKKMLDMLGVTEELKCTSLTKRDETNLRNFVLSVLYHREIEFSELKEADIVIYGPFKIANLSIWIWAARQKSGNYIIENYFLPHPVAAFVADDVQHERPIPTSHFLMMDKATFTASNIDYQIIEDDLLSTKLTPLLIDPATRLLLEMLKAYDDHPPRAAELLRLIEKTYAWIERSDSEKGPHTMILNRLQIAKRQRKLNVSEMLELGELIKSEVSADIRCGAYLLLEDNKSAQKCFNEMSAKRKKEFLTFPICHFGKLEEKSNGQQA